MMRIFAILYVTFLFACSPAFAQQFTERQEVQAKSILRNSSFENGKVGWTFSLGTPLIETSQRKGPSLSLSMSSANGTLFEQSSTDCAKLKGSNIELSMFLYATTANVKVCSLSDGSEVQCSDVASASAWKHYTFNLPTPATSCGIRVKTTASTTGTVKADDAYVGFATNVGTAAQAKKVAHLSRITTDQTVSSISTTTVQFNSGYALEGSVNTSSTYSWTSATSGTYQFIFNASLNGMTASERYRFAISLNSGAAYPCESSIVGTASRLPGSVSCIYDLSAGDVITAVVTSDADTSYTVSNGDNITKLDIVKIPSSSEIAVRPGVPSIPTVTKYKTAGTFTYTVPSGAKYLRIRMVGGGGAGASSGTSTWGAAGSNGGNTLFGAILTANGGSGSSTGYSGGDGGSYTITSPAIGSGAIGSSGSSSGIKTTTVQMSVGRGGDSALFGGGAGSIIGATGGVAGKANTGGGGSGGGLSDSIAGYLGAGGGGGGSIDAIVPGPLSQTYSVTVGAAGTAGVAGTGYAGGAGSVGYIEITEYYNAENSPLLMGSVTRDTVVRSEGSQGLNTVDAGTYTPALTNTTNISASTANQAIYSRIGNIVTVSGRVLVTCTALSGAGTTLGLSLPIATTLTTAGDLNGVVSTSTLSEVGTSIEDISNNRAILNWPCNASGSHGMRYSFQYLVR